MPPDPSPGALSKATAVPREHDRYLGRQARRPPVPKGAVLPQTALDTFAMAVCHPVQASTPRWIAASGACPAGVGTLSVQGVLHGHKIPRGYGGVGVVSTKARLADGECTLKQNAGAVEVTLATKHGGEVVEARSSVWVIGAELRLGDIKGPLAEATSVVEVTLVTQDGGEVVEARSSVWVVRARRPAFAQQPRSNSALRGHTKHHSPPVLLWCNALLREGSWWALWRGSLDGMQGVRGSNPLSSTLHQRRSNSPQPIPYGASRPAGSPIRSPHCAIPTPVTSPAVTPCTCTA
jgi:hypothetical protein